MYIRDVFILVKRRDVIQARLELNIFELQNVRSFVRIWNNWLFQTPESLAKYMDAWDIVLTEDPTVSVLMSVVKEIIGYGINHCSG